MLKRLFKNGDDLYVVIREFPIGYMTYKDGTVKNDLFNLWKEHLGADKVLKNQTHFVFCETVTEPEWSPIIEN
jgi:hypothetical protein